MTSTGVVTVPGAGGSWDAAGGGAGGAISLEAPTVRIAGTLAANGGGGGGGPSGSAGGRSGGPGDQPAAGGQTDVTKGGSGSAGAVIDGAAGTASTSHAGGGGAAGRIRINTSSGAAAITGVLSPALGTVCATQGTLRKK